MGNKSAIKILIVEDEMVIAASLEENLRELGYTEIEKARNSEEAFASFDNEPPNLAIMDIKLNGSLFDGIEIAKEFNKKQEIPLIFLSSFDDEETRNRAKKIAPSAFLLKPASIRQVDIAIDFSLNAFYNAAIPRKITSNLICPMVNNPEFIFIKGNLSFEKVNINDITFVEASSSSCYVNTSCKRYTVSTNLRNFMEQISNPQIIRMHRSYAISLNHLHAFDEYSVFITNNNEIKEIPIGKSYKKKLMKLLPKIRS